MVVIGFVSEFHECVGGLNILKGSLGKDCTEEFDRYHRWVNIDGLIGNLLLGFVDKSRDQTKFIDNGGFPMPTPRPRQI